MRIFKHLVCLLLVNILCESFAYSKSIESFSAEKELGARKLAQIFIKKYNMKVKIKRKSGNLIATINDQGFFTTAGKITRPGARFVRKLSHFLCGGKDESLDCGVVLKAHHFENGYISRNKTIRKAQYKLTAVAPQVLATKIDPGSVIQIAAGDSQPLKDIDKNEYAGPDRLLKFNNRVEIQFAANGEKI